MKVSVLGFNVSKESEKLFQEMRIQSPTDRGKILAHQIIFEQTEKEWHIKEKGNLDEQKDNYRDVVFAEVVMDMVQQFSNHLTDYFGIWDYLSTNRISSAAEPFQNFLNDKKNPASTRFRSLFPKSYSNKKIISGCIQGFSKLSGLINAAQIKLHTNNAELADSLSKRHLTNVEKCCISGISKFVGIPIENE